MALPVHAEEHYTCPDLANPEKTTIETMTQGKDGWFYRIDSELQSEFLLTDEVNRYFGRLSGLLKERGTLLVVAAIPPRAMVERRYLDLENAAQKAFSPEKARDEYTQMVQGLTQQGVLVADLLETDPPAAKVPDETPFFFRRDHHWTTYGAKLVAQKIASVIKTQPSYARLTHTEYKTDELGPMEHKGSMAVELQRLCTDKIPPEIYTKVNTQMVAGVGADALFGDAGGGAPPLVLVGSSFSDTPHFNFEGFLMEATQLELANHAISAGGPFNSLISFLSDASFETEKPAFLVWEIPNLTDLNTDALTAFRQIIPASFGACSKEQAALSASVEVKKGASVPLFEKAEAKGITGNGYYLYLETPNKALSSFTLQIDYDDADGEWFTIDQSQFFQNSGRFFLELSDEMEGHISRIKMEVLNNAEGTMEARICPYPKADATPVPAI